MTNLVSNFEYLLLLCFLTVASFEIWGTLKLLQVCLKSKEISELDFF